VKLVRVSDAIDSLQKEWELFFQGLRKLPPFKEKTLLETELRSLRNSTIQDNSLRFRMQNLQSRFNVYAEMWNRRMRELEEGPLHFKRRKIVKAQIQQQMEELKCSDESSGRHEAIKPSDEKMQEILIHDPRAETGLLKNLFDRYLDEAERTTHRRPTISFDAFANHLSQQIESVERKRQCAAVAVSLSHDEEGKVKVKFKAVKEAQ